MGRKEPQSIIEYGREVVGLERDALERLAQILDEKFENAVRLIRGMSPQGRVIVSGMGKAGVVGMKISATLASTGTPSFFLHPAEAVHGDLGRYNKHDVALLLSNSGKTEEVLRILPHLKRIGCPIVSITSDLESPLAKHSDVALPTGKVVEAGPLGLAPTTSTTVMIALGDALAMSVLSLREFSKEDYAYYHPGGELGRALMLVDEVMRRGEENCLVPETTICREALHQITKTKGRPGAASIVNTAGILVGVFTDGDLRRLLEEKSNFLDRPISEVMGKNPKTISAGKLAQEALKIMSEYKIDQLIVVDAGKKPIGLIDIQDLVAI